MTISHQIEQYEECENQADQKVDSVIMGSHECCQWTVRPVVTTGWENRSWNWNFSQDRRYDSQEVAQNEPRQAKEKVKLVLEPPRICKGHDLIYREGRTTFSRRLSGRMHENRIIIASRFTNSTKAYSDNSLSRLRIEIQRRWLGLKLRRSHKFDTDSPVSGGNVGRY